MSKRQIIQSSFATGEITDNLYGRVTTSKYKSGVKTLTNALVQSHGPLYRRAGFKYIAGVKDSTKAVRLVRFQISSGGSFILEFGESYIRFFTDSGQVLEADQTITGITAASPGVVTVTGHNLANGDHVYITGVSGMTEVNNPNQPYVVANITANTFELSGVDTSAYTAYTSGGVVNRIYEIASTYTEAELDDIQVSQFFNTLYVIHPDHAPATLTRTSTTSWALADLDLRPTPTIEIGYLPNATITPGATTGIGINFTASSGLFVNGDVGRQIVNLAGLGRASITSFTSSTVVVCEIVEDFSSTSAIAAVDWKVDLSPIEGITPSATSLGSIITLTATTLNVWRSDDLGRYVRLHGGICQITAVTSGLVVSAEVLKTLEAVTETGVWTLEDPVWNASRGYPRSVALYEQRLWFGGTAIQPQTLWASDIGLFNKFGAGNNASDSLSFDIVSAEANEIQWLAAGRELIIGTSGSEHTLSGRTGAVTPSNVDIRVRTYLGSNHREALLINNEVIFTQISKLKVRSFVYDFNTDGYKPEDLSFLAEHITSGNIKEIVFQQDPDEIIWAVKEDGDLLSATFKRDQDVIGWARHTTEGNFENVQTITVSGEDQVWVVVNRTINGATARYIELWDNKSGTGTIDGFSDSFLTLSNPLTITGITSADPGVVTSASHNLVDGDHVRILNVVGMTELNGKVYEVANKTANTFELNTFDGDNIDTSALTAYTSGGLVYKMVTSISGLDHLEGEVVQVKLDGATHPDVTVTGGAITLATEGALATVGLSYTTTIATLEPEADDNGSIQGQIKRWVRPILRVNSSAVPTVNGFFLPSRVPTDLMDVAVPLTTGDLEYGNDVWGTSGTLTITISAPLPMELVAIFGAFQSNVK